MDEEKRLGCEDNYRTEIRTVRNGCECVCEEDTKRLGCEDYKEGIKRAGCES